MAHLRWILNQYRLLNIDITTTIAAPLEVVFDLSRSIDLHKTSTAHTHEQAIAGTTTGLIELNETVTWRARHWGKYRIMTVKITQMEPFDFFEDTMQLGDFKSFRHEHYFKAAAEGTVMRDHLEFESPFGIVGKWVDRFLMKKYLHQLLITRNETIKQVAESGQWKSLPGMLPLLA